MRITLFGTYDTSMHPRIATIAEGLAANGLAVAECNAPLGLTTADRVNMLAKPWIGGPALAGRLASRWAALALRAARMPAPDVVVVGYLGHFDVHLARLVFRVRGLLRGRRIPIVLDHLINASDTGKDRRLDGGPRQVLLRMIDAGALGAADVIVVDTDEHLATLPERHRGRAVVVHVGAPAAWYEAGQSAAAPSPEEGPLRVVFYGLYTPLQGTPAIGAALGQLADGPAIDVTMIGRGQDEAEAKAAAAANQSVRWLDWVPAAELPAVVAGHDVCLGIFGTGEKARRVVPNKVFQGAAAGCAIVTSDTAPQRRVFGDAAVLVPPGDPEALAAALRELAADRGRLAGLRAAASELAAKRFAPAEVVAPLVGRLAGLAPAGRGSRRSRPGEITSAAR
ncbi:MAG TPA: glycosyltransferase [Trebonia sp.]|jgi:glycosyltransferase involved in cell wall biosynthesis|nr:glycosyltransferase [Trebonia sp.]